MKLHEIFESIIKITNQLGQKILFPVLYYTHIFFWKALATTKERKTIVHNSRLMII